MSTSPIKKSFRKKNSTPKLSSKLLKALQEIRYNLGGVVSYVFVEERIKFTGEHPKGILYGRESTLSMPINEAMFQKEIKGKLHKRTLEEIVEVFETTKDDLGATYFIIS